MGVIWTSRTRQRQPQASRINWGNSATRGLVDAWVGSVPTRTEKGQTTSIQTAGAFSVGPGGRNFTTTATGTKTGLRLAASYTSWFPSASTATIVVCYRYTDTTARASALFGADTSTTARILAHAPYSDNTLYFDFGNASGGRLSIAGFNKTTKVQTIVFIAGPTVGRQVWRDGYLLGSGASSTSVSGLSAAFALGTADIASVGADSDNVEFYAFATLAREYSAGEAATVSRNPWQLFAPQRTARIYSFPTAGGGATVAVPAGALTLTGYAPTVAATAHQTIAVPKGALVLSAFAPTVSTSAAQTIAVPLASLTLTAYAPTVYTTAVTSIAVPKGTLTLTGYAPTINYTTNATIGVPAGALTLTGYAPTVIGGTSSVWTQVSAASGTWTPASLAPGTWTPQ